MKKKGRSPVITTAIIIGAAISLMAGWSWHSVPGYQVEAGNHVVEKAYHENRTGLKVEVSGQVVRLLGDSGGRMQWFQIRTPNGQHLLVGHDNGFDDPIPLATRDTVVVRGDYEWTETGGTIRHTERDMSLERLHGWVEHKGKKYD